MNKNAKIEWLILGDVLRGSLNPRKHFDQEKITQLVQSFTEHGFTPALSHLLVRTHPTEKGKYELICGERRWRAATELGLEKVPVVVEEMADRKVLELQIVENLQREGLTALEEAEGFRALLDFCEPDGTRSHSIKSLAKEVGRTEMHIRDRLSLCRLRGSIAGDALESEELPVSHAKLLARIPAGKLRDDFTLRVLKPADGLAPIPYKQLERMIRDECQIELRGADFDGADAALVPVSMVGGDRVSGGSCSDCPFNTKNQADTTGSKLHMCMNPECFRMKKNAAHMKWMQSVTDASKGRTALSMEDCERVFDIKGKKLAYNSGFVELDAQPAEHDLQRGVKDPPTWKKLIRGQGVPVVLVKDCDGHVHEIADHRLAIAAAVENEKDKPAGERIFKPAKSAAEAPKEGWQKEEQSEKAIAEKQKEQKERERHKRINEAHFAAVIDAARGGKLPEGFWALAVDALVETTIDHGDAAFVTERRGLSSSDDRENAEEILRKFASNLALPDQISMTVELLLLLYMVDKRMVSLPKWAKVFGADLKAVTKTVNAAMLEEAKVENIKLDIAAGLEWLSFKDSSDAFEWNEHGVCTNPDVVNLVFPKSEKVNGVVRVAFSERGWKVGFSLTCSEFGGSSPCSLTDASYSNRALALHAGLLAIRSQLKENGVSEASLKRALEYIGLVKSEKYIANKSLVEKFSIAKKLRQDSPSEFCVTSLQAVLKCPLSIAMKIHDFVIDASYSEIVGDERKPPTKKAKRPAKS